MSTYKLYWGDCRQVLKNIGPVDAVITDPIWPNAPEGMFDAGDYAALLHDALELVTAQRIIIVMRYDSDPRFLQAVPAAWPFFRVQTLEYSVPGYNGRKLGGLELAYCFGTPVPSAPGRRVIPGRGPVVQPVSSGNIHPCYRNEAHFRWLVNWWTDAGETVLDPFMGSGTTGAACVQMGRHFIGIEIQQNYYDYAAARLELEKNKLRLFE